MDWSRWLNEGSLGLAVVALILACFQTWEARKQTKRLKSHSDALGLITESLSTRYLGPFPEYLSVVTDLVSSAKAELLIVVGNPTPAYFSNPALWIDYVQAVEKKTRSGVSVRLICMAENQRRQRLEQQFPTSNEEWEKWLNDHTDQVMEFLKFRFSEIKISELDYKKFLELLQTAQREHLQQSFQYNGVEVIQVPEMVTVQVWIVDKARAVFSIQTLPTNSLSHGLFTSDPHFVSALYSMTEVYGVNSVSRS